MSGPVGESGALRLVCVIVASLGLFGFSALVGLAGAAERSAVKARLLDAKTHAAAALAIRQALEAVGDAAVDAGRLEALMMANPERHVTRIDSREQLLANERQLRRDRFAGQLEKFAARVSALPPGWVARTVNTERKRINARTEAATRRDFAAAFERARAGAINQQRLALTTSLAPAPDDIQRLVEADLAGFLDQEYAAIGAIVADRGQRLVKRLMRVASADKVLFDENQAHLQRLGTDAVRTRLQALWRQLGTVRQHSGGNALERVGIQENLARDVESLAAPTVTGETWSGVFALTEAAVSRRAERLEAAHIESAIRRWFETGRCTELMADGIAGALVGELPLTLEVHRNALIPELRPGAWRAAIETHAERIASAGRADGLRNRMADPDRAPEVTFSAFDWNFEGCLTAVLGTARERVGATRLKAALPAVFDLSYAFDEASLEALLDDGPDADVPFPDAADLELSEARALFEARRGELVSEGRAAIRGQLELVGERARVARFQQQVQGLAPDERTPEARTGLAAQYLDEVRAAWAEIRPGLLLNPASDKYAALLSRVDDAIDQVITLEWEAPGRPANPGMPDDPEAAAQAGGGEEDDPLAALLPPPTDAGMCPDPVCLQAADVCARFASACAEDGAGCVEAASWRLACLSLSGRCAAASP
ncbi:MAG: hypothetical protein AAF458_00535 [Pseudomonadota bacterium]